METPLIKLDKIHHIAIICSDVDKSLDFYTNVLGLQIIQKIYREERNSFKIDLGLHDEFIIELFSFPNPPARPSYPEACGLRHLAFQVADVTAYVDYLADKGVKAEPVRVDEHTGKPFTFFADPDGLPIEIYEG